MKNDDLRNAGLKVTVPRLKILQILENSPHRHMSAESVYKALLDAKEDVGLATVYRVLTQFEAAGLVRRHNFESDHAVFELEYGDHHDHLVCVQCGTVDEFCDEVIETAQREIAKKSGYKITDHELVIYGICGECQ
ncbi:MAG: ferric iron uptake transcriptional regulator [Pseudomonadota bacterium]|nr:ferric iron uptake transcriptional regulator [Pseudomonadota bacterium]